jgi:hypothetical protein
MYFHEGKGQPLETACPQMETACPQAVEDERGQAFRLPARGRADSIKFATGSGLQSVFSVNTQ